jgi:hypothetical protein
MIRPQDSFEHLPELEYLDRSPVPLLDERLITP